MPRINRFIGNFDVHIRTIIVHDLKLIHQIRDVMRSTKGDFVILSNGMGSEAKYRIQKIQKDIIELVRERTQNVHDSSCREVTLACAILKRNNFEFVVQKASEIGVRHILPLLTARTVKTNLSFPRLEKIAQEAAEQSGQNIVPSLTSFQTLKDAVQNVEKNTLALFCDMQGISLFSQMQKTPISQKVMLFIGPEGGWSEEEREIAKECGISFVSLGTTVLRAETAAIVASYCAVTL